LDRHVAVIAVSQPVVQAHSRYFEADWHVIPNGVDTTFFSARDRPEPSPPGEEARLLFLGRLDPRNGLDTVLAAMPRVLEWFPSTHLTVAGDGPLRPIYERMARPLGSCVKFVGRVNGGRPRYYSTADLYLCPTTKASFGITLLEAMACGTPIAASDITGFRELVGDCSAALLVAKGDPNAWARAVLTLLGDRERRRAMSEAGVRTAGLFSWPRVANRILELYRRVIGC
jgi:phosphatidylinositol alpha-mannosyltransferase